MSKKHAYAQKKSSRTSELVCKVAFLLLFLLVIQLVVFKATGSVSVEFVAANIILVPAMLGVVFCKNCIFELDTRTLIALFATFLVQPPSPPELDSHLRAPHHRPPVSHAI